MKRIVLNEVPGFVSQIAKVAFDGMNLSEPVDAVEIRERKMIVLTCTFPGLLDSSFRILIFRPEEGLEFICHVKLSFRPSSSSLEEISFEYDHKALSKMSLRETLWGSKAELITTAGSVCFQEFYRALDGEILNIFRSPVSSSSHQLDLIA